MINVGQAIGYLDLDTTGFRKELSQVQQALRQFLDTTQSSSTRLIGLGQTMTSVGKKMSLGITTPLVGAAGIMTAKAGEMENAVRDIAKATGQGIDEVEKYKDVISNIYARNIGENFKDIADAISLINQQMGNLSTEEMEAVTEAALMLRDTFDIDIDEGIRGANALMNQFGLTAEEAYNYIAIGAQNGLNQNKDLADQISEYAVYYADMGMSIQDMFNNMYTGAQNGIFQIDYLNDAFKEFGINAKDTSDSVTEGYELLGLNADLMREKFAAGGESAQEVFTAVIQALAATDDQVLQNQAGVDLFGTKWEDVGQKSVMALTTMNQQLDTSKNALDEMKDVTLGDLSRNIEVLAESFGRFLLPYLIDITNEGIKFMNWLNSLDPEMKELIVQIGAFVAAAGPALMITGKITTSFSALIPIVTKVIPIITSVGSAMLGLVNPFTAVITVTGLLYAAYKNNIGGLKDITDKNIASLKNAWGDFISFAPEIPRMFIDGLVNGIRSGGGLVVSAIKDLGTSMFEGLKSAIDAHSPSKKSELVGLFWDQGLAKGLYNNSNLVEEGMNYLATLLENAGDSIQDTFVSIGKDTNTKLYSAISSNSLKIISVYEEERNKRVSLMRQGTEENVSQIQKELNATQKAYQIKMQLYQQEYNARTAMIDSAVSEEVAALQAQIDAIDDATERESRAEQEEDYQKRLAEKEAELELAKDEQEQAEIQAELDEIIYARQKQLLQQQRQDEQKALREQISEAYARAEEQKAALQEEYEAKQLQLQQQREAEIEHLTKIQELLQQDLDLRKELYETQQKIATKEEQLKTGNLSKEGKIQTTNEINELKKRENEIKTSMNRNEATFASFTPKLAKIGKDYGSVLSDGILSTEGVITGYLSRLLNKANNVISAMREAADMAGEAEVAVSSYNRAAEASFASGGTTTNNYNFYSNEAMTATEISRQFKKTQQDLALGF